MGPVHGAVDAGAGGGIPEAEQVGIIAIAALPGEGAEHLVLVVERLVQPGLDRVRITSADDRNLIIVASGGGKVRQRVQLEQRLGLVINEVRRNHVARQRHSGRREISSAFGRRRHQAGLRGGVAVADPLVADVDVRAGAGERQQVRNHQRTAQGRRALEVVIRRLRNLLAGQGKRAGIQARIAGRGAERDVVARAGAFARVAERRRLTEGRNRGVVHAAVEQQGIGSVLLGGFAFAESCRVGRGFQVGALETGLRALRRRRAVSLSVSLNVARGGALWRFRFRRWSSLGGLDLRRGLLRNGQPGTAGDRACYTRVAPGSRRRGLDFIHRQEFQLPLRTGGIRRDGDVLFDVREAEHLHANLPDTIGQIGKGIGALLIGHGHHLLVALRGRHGSAWDRQPAEFHLPVVFGGELYAGGQQQHHQSL